jgi:predicted dienelactone hydrolase
MKRLPLILLLAAGCATPQAPSGAPVGPLKVGDYTSDVGPSPTGVIPTALLHDAQRNKDVDVSIEYPTRGGPFPVIVFSHGYGATNQSYEPLVGYWVSNGFVVIRPAHADAGVLASLVQDSSRDVYSQAQRPQRNTQSQGGRPPQGAPAPPAAAEPATPLSRPNPLEAIFDKEREPQWRARVADVKLVLDQLNDLTKRFPELLDKVDSSKIAVAGHTYGALTALMVAGVNGTPDPRVKALFLMSPPGVSAVRGLTQQSFAALNIPVMFMTGTQDRGAGEGEDPAWRKQSFEFSPAGDKYFVMLQGARTMTFTGRSSAAFDTVRTENSTLVRDPQTGREVLQQENGPNQPSTVFLSDRRLFERVKVVSRMFLDAYLKNEQAARDLLVQDKMPGGVTLTAK